MESVGPLVGSPPTFRNYDKKSPIKEEIREILTMLNDDVKQDYFEPSSVNYLHWIISRRDIDKSGTINEIDARLGQRSNNRFAALCCDVRSVPFSLISFVCLQRSHMRAVARRA